MELTQLTFAVDTTPLDTADKKIRGLGEALKTIERPMSAIAKDSSTVASGVEEVASKAQVAGSKLKGVEASLEKVSTAMKIFRGETVDVGDEVVNLGSSFTKSQANFLALQKQLGASADQLKSFAKEFNDFNRITSANTFDNSIAGVQRLTKDIRELSEVNKLAAANTTLTRDQVMNLVRDTERLQQAMQSMGKSNDEINASIAQQTQQYVNLAKEKNKLIAQTKAMEDSARAAASAELERAKASAYVTKEAEKLAFVNAQLKEGFTVGSANALYKYKEALDLTAMSADQAKTKLAAFGEQLKSKQSSSPFAALVKDAEETRKQVNHLARDVSVQLGDIAISLAGGQNPFMVMIQQGDQIRGALMRAKDSGVDTSQAMKNALGQIATSFVDLGQMVGSFFVGSIQSAGNAVKRLVTEKTMLGKAIDYTNEKFGTQSETIARLGAAFTAVAGTAIVGFIASLGAMAVAYAQVVSEQDKLVKTINLVGGTLGLTADQVNTMAQTYAGATGTVTEFTNAIVEIAKTNAIPEDMIQRVSSVAIELEKVADIPVEKTVAEFAKLGEKPTEAAIKLAEATGLIDAATLKSIASLERQGNVAEAAKLAIEGYAQGLSSATEIIRSEVSSWETISNSFFESFKRGWDAIKSLFRQAPLEMRMAEAKTLYEERLAAVDNPTGLKRLQTREARQEWADEAKERLDSIRNQLALERTLGNQRQSNSEQSEFVKNTEAAINATLSQRDKLLKQISIEQKKIEDGKIEEAAGLNLIKKLRKDIADIDEREAKKNKGPKPKETFSIATDNTITETKKSLDTQLKLVKEFENNRKDALKNAYESGLISRGEYLAQETAMTIDAFESQQQVIDKYQQYLDSFNQRRINIIKSYDDAIAKGGNKQELAKQLSNELANLDRAANGASETLDAMRASLSAATDKRFTESWKESNKALMESKKAYEEFESSVNNANQERQSEIQLQIQLSSAYGAEAEAIKASTAAMKSYAPAINKMALELRKAQQEYDNFMNNIDYSDDSKFEAQMLDAARLQKNLAQQRTNYNNAIALARRDSEQAATDASIKYQIEKYNELKGTLSDSIYTAIFEGGKQGGDALKNYLMKEFKNFVIKVFIEPIVGSIMGSFTGASVASGASGSSGGGVMGTIGNVISTGSTVMKMLTNPMVLGNQMAQGVVAVGDALFKAGFEQMGNAVTGWASTANASAILGSIGSVVGGYGISKVLSGGYKTGLGDAVDIAGAVGSYFFGPVAGVVSGLVNRAFGRKLKDTGIEGTFSNAGFEGQNYQFYKGGWLRSDKTTYSEMDQTMENLLSYQFKQLQLSTAILATSIGASVDSIKDFTKKIKVSFKGLDENQINEKLTEVYDEISNDMAAGVLRELVKESDPEKYNLTVGSLRAAVGGSWGTQGLSSEIPLVEQIVAWQKELDTGISSYSGKALTDKQRKWLENTIEEANKIIVDKTSELVEEYQWFGETFSETLKRLSSSITTVNESFKDLGYTLVDVSLQGASKASDIISLFGGEDQYIQATGYFYENAYSQEEKAANLTNRLSEALGRVNEKLPDSISDYRDLVDAYAKQGDAGREVWASLVQLFPAFVQMVDLNKEIENSFSGLNDLLGNYYEKFGTETERVAFQTGLLQKSLAEVGIELPKTREEYVSQVKAYQNLGDAGREVLTVLLNNADAFENFYKSIENADQAYARLKTISKTSEDIARERISLEERLFNATATTAEIAEKARSAIDPLNQSLYDSVIAAEAKKVADERIANEEIGLKERLFNATATTAQAADAARNAIDPLNLALYDSVIAAENAKAAAEERKGLEVELLQLLGNTTALRERELEALDASNRALQQRIWALEDARDATDKALAALERATAEQIKTLEKTFTATDLAMQVLEKAVDKENQRLQDQLKSAQDSSNALKKVFDTLEEAIKSLRAQVEPTAKLAVQEARAVLSSALTSGIPSDTTALEDAVGVLKADVEKGLYATSYDKSRAFLTLANDLEKLKQNSEPQLTDAEQQVKLAEAQIKQLDDLLTTARDQIDAVRGVDASLFGIDESITAVELAQKQLLSATQAEQEARLQIDKLNEQLLEFKTQVEVLRSIDNSVIDVETAVLGVKEAISTEMKAIADAVAMSKVSGSGSGGGGGGGGITPRPPTTTNTDARKSAIESLYQSYLGRPADAAGLDWYINSNKTLEQIRDDFIFQSTSISPIAAGNQVLSNSEAERSLRSDQISSLYQQYLGRPADEAGLAYYASSDKSLRQIAADLEYAKSVGAYADGGYYPGGLALVGEEGPELINFDKPGMVYTAAQSANLMQADNSDLAEELRALRQEVQMLRAEARATAVNTSKTARILDDVTQGGDSLKTTTA